MTIQSSKLANVKMILYSNAFYILHCHFAFWDFHFAFLGLGPFRSVFRSSLLPVWNSCSVENSPDNVISHSRQIRHSSPADHDNRVFLQIVANSGNIGCHFHAVGEAHTRDFPKGGIRFFGSGRRNFHANAAFEGARGINRAVLNRIENPRHRGRLGFFLLDLSGPFFELVDSRHICFAIINGQKSKFWIFVFASRKNILFSVNK